MRIFKGRDEGEDLVVTGHYVNRASNVGECGTGTGPSDWLSWEIPGKGTPGQKWMSWMLWGELNLVGSGETWRILSRGMSCLGFHSGTINRWGYVGWIQIRKTRAERSLSSSRNWGQLQKGEQVGWEGQRRKDPHHHQVANSAVDTWVPNWVGRKARPNWQWWNGKAVKISRQNVSEEEGPVGMVKGHLFQLQFEELIFTEHLHSSKCFAKSIPSLHSYSEVYIPTFPFSRWEHWHSERVRHLPKVTEGGSSRPRIGVQSIWLQNSSSDL